MNDKCKSHKPKKLPYIGWHTWAADMDKKGERQTQCPVCKHWFFKCEY